jgi:hypothetical protein
VADVTELEFGETRGRQAITVTFVGGVKLGPYRMSDVDVRDATNAIVGQLYDFADPALIKSGWNWNLFNNDGSLGIHNPFFATDGLSAARDTMVAALTTRTPASNPAPLQRSEELQQGIRDDYKRAIKRSRRP